MRFALAAAAAALTLVAGAGATQLQASVRPIDLAPLTVRGLRFQAGEPVTVRVIVRDGARVAKSTHAGARGGFTVRFASLSLSGCSGYWIRATGARGSLAGFTMLPAPCGAAP